MSEYKKKQQKIGGRVVILKGCGKYDLQRAL